MLFRSVQRLNALLSAHAAAGGSTLLTSHQSVVLVDPVPTQLELDAALAPREGTIAA